ARRKRTAHIGRAAAANLAGGDAVPGGRHGDAAHAEGRAGRFRAEAAAAIEVSRARVAVLLAEGGRAANTAGAVLRATLGARRAWVARGLASRIEWRAGPVRALPAATLAVRGALLAVRHAGRRAAFSADAAHA